MTDETVLKEVIEQLKDLHDHCHSLIDKNEPYCVWERDCRALSGAIAVLEKLLSMISRE